MYMINLLLPDGREAVFFGSAKQRWTAEQVGSAEKLRDQASDQEAANKPDSIFSVWAITTGDSESRALHPRKTEDFPLSQAGLDKIARYNP